MKKNYIEPSMMVVTLNANTILAGSTTPGFNPGGSSDIMQGKEAEYTFDLVDVEE